MSPRILFVVLGSTCALDRLAEIAVPQNRSGTDVANNTYNAAELIDLAKGFLGELIDQPELIDLAKRFLGELIDQPAAKKSKKKHAGKSIKKELTEAEQRRIWGFLDEIDLQGMSQFFNDLAPVFLGELIGQAEHIASEYGEDFLNWLATEGIEMAVNQLVASTNELRRREIAVPQNRSGTDVVNATELSHLVINLAKGVGELIDQPEIINSFIDLAKNATEVYGELIDQAAAKKSKKKSAGKSIKKDGDFKTGK